MIKFEGLPEDAKLNNKIKYAVEQIKLHWNKPQWWRSRFMRYIVINIANKYWERKYSKEKVVTIMEEDWDNLIILDACRYDLFSELASNIITKGKLEYRISRGSETSSFLLENFGNGKYDDVIYITANPWVDKLLKDKFYKIISVWKHGWNDKYNTVLPETIYEYTLKVIKKYSNKRLIIHFIQPHYPYIGYNFTDGTFEALRNSVLHNKESKLNRKYKDSMFAIYSADLYAMIDKNIHFKAYRSNLEKALPYVEKLVDTLPGRTIVTSDHGEAFGEKIHPLLPIRVYGHPRGIKIPVLVKVPWLVVETNNKSCIDIEKELARIRKKKQEQENKKIRRAIRNLKTKNRI